jgi:release factor glutamine methyltransferase
MRLNDIKRQLNSSLEARMLIKHVTGLNDADLISMDSITLSEQQKSQLDDMIAQRLKERPISKIIGYKEFYGRDFIVTDDVLDPRPDSETLIEAVLEHVPLKENIKIVDLGTGSGCLILTLLAELPNAKGVATDISPKALEVAQKNACQLGVSDRVELIESNWFEQVEGKYDVIVTNPPYIESEVVPTLDKNVRDFDPILALDGGADGLLPYKMILPQVKKYLKTGGMIAFEHGYDQCGRIKRLIEKEGFSQIRAHQDLGGEDRVLTAIHI